MSRCWLAGLTALLALSSAACGPAPTPFPVDIPVEETAALPEPPPSLATMLPAEGESAQPVRYALAPNAAGHVPELALIQTAAQVEQLTEPVDAVDAGARYDIIAGYGDLPGGMRGPVLTRVGLAIGQSPPLDDPGIVDVLRQSLSLLDPAAEYNLPGAMLEARPPASQAGLRAQLANLGWPDGFDLPLAAAAPGAHWLAVSLAGLNIILQPRPLSDTEAAAALSSGQYPLALVLWRTPAERQRWEALVGPGRLLEAFALPVSYLAAPELNITFTDGGWPMPVR